MNGSTEAVDESDYEDLEEKYNILARKALGKIMALLRCAVNETIQLDTRSITISASLKSRELVLKRG